VFRDLAARMPQQHFKLPRLPATEKADASLFQTAGRHPFFALQSGASATAAAHRRAVKEWSTTGHRNCRSRHNSWTSDPLASHT